MLDAEDGDSEEENYENNEEEYLEDLDVEALGGAKLKEHILNCLAVQKRKEGGREIQGRRDEQHHNSKSRNVEYAVERTMLLNIAEVGDRLHFIGQAPVIRISALSGRNVGRLWPALAESVMEYQTRIPTRRVNEVVRAAQAAHPAPGGVRVLYATQGATDPPTFTLFANREVPKTWLRYLERKIREDLNLGATAIKLRVRRRSE